jgi:hypothetical protein
VNEESVKIKYVVPWLAGAGVTADELQFERSFRVQIGRQRLLIGDDSEDKWKGARLDILVRRGELNLFVVETKGSDEALTEGDRDQAISYARLLHPVAPYAVVTNGHEWHLYEVMSQHEIRPEEIPIRGYTATLPDNLIVEAQRTFLGLSRANINQFCREQTGTELRLVAGRLGEDRKYIPELYVTPDALKPILAEFFQSPKPGLILVGDSGTGKTCAMCSIVGQLLVQGQAVLFYNGISLAGSIPDAIAGEFQWSFSGSDAPMQILKRLESFMGDTPLTIVIDAIDEWPVDSRTQLLATMLKAAENRRIRLLMSCKPSAVEQFLQVRSTPTQVQVLATVVDLPALSTREFYTAVDKYRQAYDFRGGFEKAVLQAAQQNLFLLRVLFDVARDHRLLHLTFSAAEFFEVFHEQSLQKTGDLLRAGNALRAFARLLYERNADALLEDDVNQALGMSVNETLMDELFEYRLLVRTGSPGDHRLSFYFQQLRDYIIAFQVLHLDRLAPAEFQRQFQSTQFPSTNGEVFALYYRLAPPERQRLIDGEMRENAHAYLRCYVSLIQTHFPALLSALSPHGESAAGFVGELDLAYQQVRLHGFRPLATGDEPVHFVPAQRAMDDSNLADLTGVKEMHFRSSALGFRNGINIAAEVVDCELLPQLRKLVEAGELNESNNPDLLIELLIETVLIHRDWFGSLFARNSQSLQYPLRFDAITESLLRERLTRHYQDDIVVRKRQSGEIPELWVGDVVRFTYARTPVDDDEVQRRVEDAVATGHLPTIRTRYQPLDSVSERLQSAIGRLSPRREINGPLFDDLRRLDYRTQPGEFWPSLEASKQTLAKLMLSFISNYQTLIDTNFPTLRQQFALRATLPRAFYLKIEAPRPPNFDVWLVVLSAKSSSDKSSVRFAEEIRIEPGTGRASYRVDDIVIHDCEWMRTDVQPFISGLGTFGRMHLRAMVYGQIRRELDAVEKEFRKIILARPAGQFQDLANI